jgi:hypothetical protein
MVSADTFGPGSAEIALRRYFSAPRRRQVEEVSQVPPSLVRPSAGVNRAARAGGAGNFAESSSAVIPLLETAAVSTPPKDVFDGVDAIYLQPAA